MAKASSVQAREWWNGLDAHGKEWRIELGKESRDPANPTDRELDSLLSGNEVDLYVYKGGKVSLKALDAWSALTTLQIHGFTEVTGLESLRAHRGLESLALGSNNLKAAPDLGSFTKLEDLDLAQNQIADLSFLKPLKRLKKLNLGYNAVVDIEALAGLTELEELVLAYNKIKSLEPLQGLVRLKKLYLQDNAFATLEPLRDLAQLTDLDISGPFNKGKVTDLAPLGGMKKLSRLLFGSQKVADISPLAGCSSLELVDTTVNPAKMRGFASLVPLKKLKKIITHSAIMGSSDRAAFKKARPKVEVKT